MEVKTTVVDAVEPTLQAVVFATDAGQEAVLAADRHVKGVNTVVDSLGYELCEHDGGPAVQGGVAEVVLPGGAERGVDHELLRRLVVGGRGTDGRDIRTVTGLGHRECAGHLEAHDAGQELLVVTLGAEVEYGRSEEAPLHAGLDLQ